MAARSSRVQTNRKGPEAGALRRDGDDVNDDQDEGDSTGTTAQKREDRRDEAHPTRELCGWMEEISGGFVRRWLRRAHLWPRLDRGKLETPKCPLRSRAASRWRTPELYAQAVLWKKLTVLTTANCTRVGRLTFLKRVRWRDRMKQNASGADSAMNVAHTHFTTRRFVMCTVFHWDSGAGVANRR